MSDHNHDAHGEHGAGHPVTHGAGHEMDVPPTKELFNIVWGLGALTLLSLATCVQLFNNQQRDIMEERGRESGLVLAQYRQSMDAMTKSAGEASFKDSTGAEIKQRYVPLAVARELVLSKPERLLAAPAPAGWQHPDDIAAGGQAAPAGGATPTGGALPAPPSLPAGANPGEAPIVPGQPGVVAPDGATPTEPGKPVGDPQVNNPQANNPSGAPAGAAGTPGVTGTDAAPGTQPNAAPAGTPAAGNPAPATGHAQPAGKAGPDAGQSGAAPTPAPAH